MIARALQVAIGLWLMFAPWALDHGDPAAANDRIFGPIAAAIAFVALWEVARSIRWWIVPFAGWLVVAPLVLWYGDVAAFVNSAACGAALVGLSFLGGQTKAAFGGGWSTLWEQNPQYVPEDALRR